MKLTPREIAKISNRTLDHYNQHAEGFWQSTRDHDVSQNIAALVEHIEGNPPFKILDFGCGPGRDLKMLSNLGHIAIGLDGSARFATMAQEYSGCKVYQQNFLELDLPPNFFDGVFANAALFHVPRQELPRVLLDLYATLKPRGVLFSSNPRGNGEEGWNCGRYGAYYDLKTWRNYLSTTGFIELTHYYRPTELPHEQQFWLASVWRKAGGSHPL